MKHIYEYQDWRKLKKKLREKGILKSLRYKVGDTIVLKNGRKARIYKINPYDKDKNQIGNYNKDYMITWLDREIEPEEFAWQSSVDENEINHEESEFYSNINKYNL